MIEIWGKVREQLPHEGTGARVRAATERNCPVSDRQYSYDDMERNVLEHFEFPADQDRESLQCPRRTLRCGGLVRAPARPGRTHQGQDQALRCHQSEGHRCDQRGSEQSTKRVPGDPDMNNLPFSEPKTLSQAARNTVELLRRKGLVEPADEHGERWKHTQR